VLSAASAGREGNDLTTSADQVGQPDLGLAGHRRDRRLHSLSEPQYDRRVNRACLGQPPRSPCKVSDLARVDAAGHDFALCQIGCQQPGQIARCFADQMGTIQRLRLASKSLDALVVIARPPVRARIRENDIKVALGHIDTDKRSCCQHDNLRLACGLTVRSETIIAETHNLAETRAYAQGRAEVGFPSSRSFSSSVRWNQTIALLSDTIHTATLPSGSRVTVMPS
jgi:hypothetical protein